MRTVPLSHAAEVVLGRQRAPQYEEGEGQTSYLRSANIKDGRLDLSDVKSMRFSPGERMRYELRAGDVLVTEGSGSRDSVGASAVWLGELANPVCFQNTLLRLRPRAGVSGRYLGWWARYAHASGLVQDVASGANILHVGAEAMRSLPLALPDLEEQQRIADFLDDQVACLDAIAATLSSLKRSIRSREAAAIRAAVCGPTPLHQQAAVPAYGDAHEVRSIAALCRLQRGVDLTAEEQVAGPVAVVTTAGISGRHDRAIVKGPGVVVGRYGTVGNVFWINEPHWPHNTTLYVRNYQGNDPRYVFYVLKVFPWSALQARAAVPGVNRNDLARMPVPWLPPEEQRLVVRQLDDQLDDCQQVEATITLTESLILQRKQALITACVTEEFDVSSASSRAVDAALAGSSTAG